jgi:secondary thiamine-phosphate synthase enzyme
MNFDPLRANFDVVKRLAIQSTKKEEMIDVTADVRRIVRESGVLRGICHLFVPHTTAGITVNENTDPNVKLDIVAQLEKAIPREGKYRHAEGNAAAHIKSSIIGSSLTIFIENGKLVLGTWQAIFLCEFDGPRSRNILVKVT